MPTERGDCEDSDPGAPQGGILSPLLANIALHVLGEHVMAPGAATPCNTCGASPAGG